MKINNECARKILIEVEKIPFGETITVASLQEKLMDYSGEDVLGLVTLFNKEHLINVLDKVSYDDNDVLRDHKIKCLTERGYKLLDLIRDDETWNYMKEIIADFENISIFSIFEIANKIKSVRYNELFDLPSDLVILSSRW